MLLLTFSKKKSLFIANSPITLVSVPNHLPKTQQSYRNGGHRLFVYTAKITVNVVTVTHRNCRLEIPWRIAPAFGGQNQGPLKAFHRHCSIAQTPWHITRQHEAVNRHCDILHRQAKEQKALVQTCSTFGLIQLTLGVPWVPGLAAELRFITLTYRVVLRIEPFLLWRSSVWTF